VCLEVYVVKNQRALAVGVSVKYVKVAIKILKYKGINYL